MTPLLISISNSNNELAYGLIGLALLMAFAILSAVRQKTLKGS